VLCFAEQTKARITLSYHTSSRDSDDVFASIDGIIPVRVVTDQKRDILFGCRCQRERITKWEVPCIFVFVYRRLFPRRCWLNDLNTELLQLVCLFRPICSVLSSGAVVVNLGQVHRRNVRLGIAVVGVRQMLLNHNRASVVIDPDDDGFGIEDDRLHSGV
jgi:hypothetical protein